MPYTLAQVREDVRERLDEISEGFWRNKPLDEWVHQAATDMARRSMTLLDVRPLPVLALQQEVPAPTDTVRLASNVYWQPENSTQKYPLTYTDWNVADGVWWTQQSVTQHPNPTIFTTWGMAPTLMITLYPTPSRAGTIICHYYRLPIRASGDTHLVEVPEGWIDLVMLFVEAIALRKDRDPRWTESRNMYEEGLREMKEILEKNAEGQSLIAAGRSVIPGWLYEMDEYY